MRQVVRTGVAMLLLGFANLALPQLWAGPDAAEPRLIADFKFIGDSIVRFEDSPALSAISGTGHAAAAIGDSCEAVAIWDAKRGERSAIRLTSPKPKERLRVNDSSETTLAFSASGETLVARDASFSGRDRLRIWSPPTSQSTPTLIPLGSHVFAVSPDGRLVAGIGKRDKAVSVWDAKSGGVVTKIPFAKKGTPGPGPGLTGLIFTPDGKQLVIDDYVEKSGQHTLMATEITPAAVAPTAAAPRIIGQTYLGLELLQVRGLELSQTAMGFLDGGKTLVTLGRKRGTDRRVYDWEICYWNMVAGGERRAPATFSATQHSVESCVLSPYGGILAITTDNREGIRIVDLATGKTRFEIALPKPAGTVPPGTTWRGLPVRTTMAPYRVGELFVDAAGKYLGAGTNNFHLRVWDLTSEQAGDASPSTGSASGKP